MQQKAKAVTSTVTHKLEPIKSPALSSLTKDQSAYLIDETQARITANMDKLAKLEPSLREYQEAYMALKKEHDSISSRIEADNIVLGIYSKLTNGLPSNASLRIPRAESHNDMKPREKRKLSQRSSMPKIPWTDYAAEVLTIQRKFIVPEQLYLMVVDKFKIKELFEEHNKKYELGVTRWAVIHACWFANCKQSEQGKKRGKLIHIENRMGLIDWVDDNMQLRPEFIVSTNQ